MTPCMWTSIFYELSPEDALRRIRDIGWPAVELSTEHLVALREDADSTGRARALRQMADGIGLAMPQAHLTIHVDIANADIERRERDQAIVRRDVELLSEMGIAVGVLHCGGGGEHPGGAREAHQIRVAAISDLAEHAARLGVRLALENGTGRRGGDEEPDWDGSVKSIRMMIGRIGSPALGICLDTGHAILENWDNAEAARVAGDLLIALHIADNDGSGDQHRIPFAYGTQVDWPAVVAAIRGVGYQGPFNLEIPGERGRPLEILDAVVRYALEVSQKLLDGEVGPPTRR